ncbi:glycosyltransferase [Algoriphagus namhaensis]|uniref:Glycosyltransferase n=1 Tax=Algoriphagus namhaensis TaxID=915353 RepID=A0ABV8ASW6_9BACT
MYNYLFYLLIEFLGIFFLVMSLSVVVVYVIIMILSAIEMRNHRRRNRFTDYEDIISSPLVPEVSIVAPAFNEAESIVQNAKSLLSLHYAKLEVIIINDGSKDDTLARLVEAFDLVKVPFAYEESIPTARVNGVYKSPNSSFEKLIVVDKENGGKADALNAGINVSSGELLACIDVDCILSSDSILKMVRPFMSEVNRKVIAVGGVIGIANNCDITDGTVTKYRAPDSLLGRFQVIEYFRAFLMGRMAANRINGLILISGAFGFFRRDLVLEVGGYLTKTVGEDMELIVRMRRHMEEKGVPYKVDFVPDPLCWTEVPETVDILSKQRNRWIRGTIETLQLHQKIKLNPKYGVMGMVSYPYWSLFEKFAPIIEGGGILYTLLLILLGDFSVFFFIALFIVMYLLFVMVSSFSILFEQIFYNNYKDKKDLNRLIRTILVEPFAIHPQIIWWGIRGHWDFIKGKGGWGKMIHGGFKKAEDKKKLKTTQL